MFYFNYKKKQHSKNSALGQNKQVHSHYVLKRKEKQTEKDTLVFSDRMCRAPFAHPSPIHCACICMVQAGQQRAPLDGGLHFALLTLRSRTRVQCSATKGWCVQ